MKDGYVALRASKYACLAFAGGDCLIDIVANVFPRTGAVSERAPQEIGTGEIGGAAPTSEIDL